MLDPAPRVVAADRVREITPGAHNPFPTEWPLIALQYGSAAVTAFVYAFLVDAIASAIMEEAATGEVTDARLIVSAAITLTTGPPLVALVVWAIGRYSQYYEGSFWWALAGAYAGQLLATSISLIGTFSAGQQTDGTRALLFLSSLLLPSVGSVLAYALTRRPMAGTRVGSLWNLEGGNWSVGMPLPTLLRTRGGVVFAGLTLARGRF